MSTKLPDGVETRAAVLVADEIRGDGPLTIRGVAAVYDTVTTIGPWFRERIARGAFRSAIARGDDVRALVNHDPNLLLGRTTNGTLKLEDRDDGLHYEIALPNTQAGRDLHELVRRGDISQSSFGFRVLKEAPLERGQGDELPLRTIEDVELYDVSPVTYPAYPTTSVSARSAAAALSADPARTIALVQVLRLKRALDDAS